jgi:4-hydroxythreonine-4-phosphate dehydrogenase
MTLALTMGDPAGIGGEIAVAAWRAGAPRFVALADPDWLAAHGAPVRLVAHPGEATFADAIAVIPVPLAGLARPGRPDPANAAATIASIEHAVRLAQSGAVTAVVTNPIAKSVLQRAGFAHPGHTEFLAELTGVPGRQVMMLACPGLRVVPVTIHVSLRRALDTLDTAAIVEAARTTDRALRRDFGIASPRLAVAGLNPHAGEDGTMGTEERTLIQPAIDALRKDGLSVSGPWPPDTMFTPRARSAYDVAICMYHDQALIPLKTVDMAGGVNVTLGLPIVRTSPDHGTAFDIAGRGVADPASLIAALRMAEEIAAHRAAGLREPTA